MLSFIMRFERDPDRDRFAALYQMNHTRMERLARQLLGDQNRAEDAVHDTFMKLIRHYDELRDRSNERLASWLLVVVKTTALDMLRRDKWENACEELPEGAVCSGGRRGVPGAGGDHPPDAGGLPPGAGAAVRGGMEHKRHRPGAGADGERGTDPNVPGT